jgi:hypothetical protein
VATSPVLIEIRYSDGCPYYEPTLELVRLAVSELGIDAEVIETRVRDFDHAKQIGFPGSPTVLVNGRDIEPLALTAIFRYRVYETPNGISGVPPRPLLDAALLRAR